MARKNAQQRNEINLVLQRMSQGGINLFLHDDGYFELTHKTDFSLQWQILGRDRSIDKLIQTYIARVLFPECHK